MKIELSPMTAAEFETFLNRNVSRYAQELLLTKQTEVEAHAMAEAQGAMNEVLPQGLETPLNYILLARDENGMAVGEVWCDTTEPETVFLNDLYVYSKCRRQGVGTAIIAAVATPLTQPGQDSRFHRATITTAQARDHMTLVWLKGPVERGWKGMPKAKS